MTFCSVLAVERRWLHEDSRLCGPHLQMLPQQGWWQLSLTLLLPVTLGSSQMTLEMKGLAKLAPAHPAHGLGEQRDCPCVTVDSSHSKKREGPLPHARPWQVARPDPRVGGPKLWALVQSRYQSQVSKLGLESLPLVWEASAGLRAH